MASGDIHPSRVAWRELTFPDLARRTNNGQLIAVVNSLSQKNRILEDIQAKEATNWTTEVFGYETALPKGQFSSYGQGIQPERSDQDLVSEETGSLDSLSRVNWKMIRDAANPDEIRTQEDMRFIKGMSHTMVGTLLYGNEAVNPKQWTGLTPRYNSKAQETVYTAGGSGNDLMSLWVINWNLDDGAYVFYPQGRSDMGITMFNLGAGHATDTTNGGEFVTYRTFFDIEWGLAIKREDNVARYGDIEQSASGMTFDHKILIELLNDIWEPEGLVIYGNRKMLTQIDLVAVDRPNVEYRSHEVFGKPTKHFQGYPLKLVEQLLRTESALAA